MQIIKLEDELNDGKAYLVNNTFSVADILMGTCLQFALNLVLDTPLKVPENCTHYLNDLKQREGFKKAFELNYPEQSS